jgi:hypothetical protein
MPCDHTKDAIQKAYAEVVGEATGTGAATEWLFEKTATMPTANREVTKSNENKRTTECGDSCYSDLFGRLDA